MFLLPTSSSRTYTSKIGPIFEIVVHGVTDPTIKGDANETVRKSFITTFETKQEDPPYRIFQPCEGIVVYNTFNF